MFRTSIALSCLFGFVAWYYGRDYLPLRKANYNEAATNESTKDSPLPVLTRIDPVKVGHVRDVHIMPGKVHKMRTLSLRPLLFEIEDFLTPKECDDIIYMAQTQGMEKSLTVSEAPAENNNEKRETVTDEATVNEESEIANEKDPKTKIVPPDDPVAAFQRTDIDEDGKLDLSEIKFGLRALGSVFLNEDDFKKIMTELELDPNNDGVVTYEEYIDMAQNDKLNEIITYLEHLKETKPHKRTRNSYTAFLDPYDHIGSDSLFEDINSRIQTVSGLPMGLIRSSETLQVLQYNAKQHYHCHYDTESEEDRPGAPCCHNLMRFADIEEECRPCRFMTFFYYLHEPEEGGETAFPIADNETMAPELISTMESYRCDLSTYCHKANLVYKPKKGAAILWYNHLLDEESGWLGPRDALSYHGGCDVIKGTKWAANNWLNAGKDREKDMAAWKEWAEIEALEALQKYSELTREEEGKDERSDIQQSIDEGPLDRQQERVQQEQEEDKEQEPVQEEKAKIEGERKEENRQQERKQKEQDIKTRQEHKEEDKNQEPVQEEQVKIRQEP